MKATIDFETMRENCIQTHQVTYELFALSNHIGVPLNLKVNSADDLRTNEETKSWDGMGRFSKELHDNENLWNSLPDELWIPLPFNGQKIKWSKEKAKRLLMDSFLSLGGYNLYNV